MVAGRSPSAFLCFLANEFGCAALFPLYFRLNPQPCAQIDLESNEIAGVFESIQPSDTDLGSKAPKDIKITGIWYGQLS